MTELFIAAFGMGLVFNAAPGAVFTATIRHGLRGGFRPALQVQIGSLVGDASWAALGLMGVGLLFQMDAVRLPLGLAGVAYLVWLAWDAWKDADAEFSVAADNAFPEGTGSATRTGVTLSVTNPQNIAFWAAIGSALGSLGVGEPTTQDYAVFFTGFMAASVAWAFICAALVVRTLGRAQGAWVQLTYRLCAVMFLCLALSSLYDLLGKQDRRPMNANGEVLPASR